MNGLVLESVTSLFTVIPNLKALLSGGEVYQAVLENGWTGELYYMKNDMGLGFIWGKMDVGVTDSGTIVTTLPADFRPKNHHPFLAYNTYTLSAIGGLFLSRSLNIILRNPAASSWNTGHSVYFNTVYYIDSGED